MMKIAKKKMKIQVCDTTTEEMVIQVLCYT